jgi:hypothetical protein
MWIGAVWILMGPRGGILFMWDNRVVKVEECVGAYTLAVSFRNLVDLSVWANGASGGILIIWDNRVVEKVEECVGAYTLAVSFRNVVDLSVWDFAGVYGPNSDRNRRLLWDELAGVLSLWNLPWCIGGDFNVTRFSSERSGTTNLDSAMMEFSKFIFEQGLMDLPLAGGSFTWLISHDPPLWSRIDRFLVSSELETWFPGIPRLCSDHFPILLDTGNVSWGRRPFKFENMWLKAEGFVAHVKQWWDSYVFQGTPSFVLARKFSKACRVLFLLSSSKL